MSKKIEDRYKLLTEREKCLLRPARYLGSNETTEIELFREDGKTKKIVQQTTVYNPAFLKMFDEVISNSVDASTRKELKHLDTIKVEVQKLTGMISVTDNGGIPVEMHKVHNQYVPEMIFGNMHSGENFNDDPDSVATGSNGEGSSLVNIFSTHFQVITADGKKGFSKVWKNNMADSEDAVIRPSKNKGTKVSYIPDYEKLGCELLKDNNFELLRQRTMEIAACNPHLNVSFNGELFKFNSFKDYVKLFQDDFIYIENEDWKVAIAPSETGTLENISFTNSTNNYVGGTHVHYIADQLVNDIRLHIKKKYKYDVKPAEIKNHFRVFIDASIVNPRYNSQTKEDLVTLPKNYKTSIDITAAFTKKVINSPVLERLVNWLESKKLAEEKREAKKNDKTNKRNKVVGHLPANSNDVEKRILFITEGLSAISNLINVRDPDIHGGYPLKGKFTNTRELNPATLLEKNKKGEFARKEVAELMSVIGLNSDGTFSLNYGTIAIMADADQDGNCIVGLLLNFFSRWPLLFEQNRVKILTTPITIAHKGSETIRFYTFEESLKFDSTGYKVEYLKGLGSLSEAEYDRAINIPRFIDVSFSEACSSVLDLVFNKGKNPVTKITYADERKDWLLN